MRAAPRSQRPGCTWHPPPSACSWRSSRKTRRRAVRPLATSDGADGAGPLLPSARTRPDRRSEAAGSRDARRGLGPERRARHRLHAVLDLLDPAARDPRLPGDAPQGEGRTDHVAVRAPADPAADRPHPAGHLALPRRDRRGRGSALHAPARRSVRRRIPERARRWPGASRCERRKWTPSRSSPTRRIRKAGSRNTPSICCEAPEASPRSRTRRATSTPRWAWWRQGSAIASWGVRSALAIAATSAFSRLAGSRGTATVVAVTKAADTSKLVAAFLDSLIATVASPNRARRLRRRRPKSSRKRR